MDTLLSLTSPLLGQNDAKTDSGSCLDDPPITKIPLYLLPGRNFRARRLSALSEIVGTCRPHLTFTADQQTVIPATSGINEARLGGRARQRGRSEFYWRVLGDVLATDDT